MTTSPAPAQQPTPAPAPAAPPAPPSIKFDGVEVRLSPGATILEAARDNGIYIPTLCYDPRMKAYGACRMCVVGTEGRPGFPAACVTPAAPNTNYLTASKDVVALRQSILGMLMAEHPHGCLTCDRITHCGPTDICLRNVSVTDRCVICPQNQRCELQATVELNGVDNSIYDYRYRNLPLRTDDPYIHRDYNLCIACARCVRVCNEVVGADAISMVDRGDGVLPGTPFNVAYSDPLSGCIFCGACVDACPVGALTEADNKWAGLPDTTVSTICTQCEINCLVNVEMKNGKVLRVMPDVDGAANGGLACIQGKFQLQDPMRREDRLLTPQVRRNGQLADAAWDDAIAAIAAAVQKSGGEGTAVVSTGAPTNEDLYLLQKLARQVIGTSALDNLPNALSPAIAEVRAALGDTPSTNALQEIALAKAVLMFGADLNQTHPVAAFQVHKAANYRDAQVIVATPDDSYVELNRAATLRLPLKPGTDRALVRGLLKVVVEESLADQAYVTDKTEGFDALTASLANVSVDDVAKETGVPAASIRAAARAYARTKPAVITYAVDTERDSTGVAAALADLALITGNIGKANSGLFVFHPDGNAQGAQDMGMAPHDGERGLSAILDGIEAGRITSLLWFGDLPFGVSPAAQPGALPHGPGDPSTPTPASGQWRPLISRNRHEQDYRLGPTPSPASGEGGGEGRAGGESVRPERSRRTAPERMGGVTSSSIPSPLAGEGPLPIPSPLRGEGEDGGETIHPLLQRLNNALPKLNFLAVMALAPRELAATAHVLLPAADFLEREGTYANVERRVQRIRPAYVPKGQSRAYSTAVIALARALLSTGPTGAVRPEALEGRTSGQADWSYTTTSAVFDDLAAAVPGYAGLSYAKMDQGVTGLLMNIQGVRSGDPLGQRVAPRLAGKGRLAGV